MTTAPAIRSDRFPSSRKTDWKCSISAPALATGPRADAVPADSILRALTQLLVEKGVITREELVERVGSIEGKTDDESG